MLNIGAGEMMLILVVALLILGPTRLPELARGIGKFMREFRRQTDDVRNMVEREFYKMDEDLQKLDIPSSIDLNALPDPHALTDPTSPMADRPDPALYDEYGHPRPPAEPGHDPEAAEATLVGSPTTEETLIKPRAPKAEAKESAPGSANPPEDGLGRNR
jgi:sec-independent protein translocase protein TatB